MGQEAVATTWLAVLERGKNFFTMRKNMVIGIQLIQPFLDGAHWHSKVNNTLGWLKVWFLHIKDDTKVLTKQEKVTML